MVHSCCSCVLLSDVPHKGACEIILLKSFFTVNTNYQCISIFNASFLLVLVQVELRNCICEGSSCYHNELQEQLMGMQKAYGYKMIS